MKIKIQDIASLVNGKIFGDVNLEIKKLAKIEDAKPGDLTFLYLPHYEKFFSSTKASVILVKPDFNRSRNDITYIVTEAPEKAFFAVTRKYFTPNFPLEGIDPTAFVHPKTVIGKNVGIGKNVIISVGCKLGDNTKIFHNSVLFDNVELGDDCLIFSNVSIREECKLGNRIIIHDGTVIGSDGFGFNPDANGVYQKIPQIGNVIIEDDVELGSNVSVDRAAMGSTIIKRGTKIDNLVQVAHNVIIGEDTVISSQTGISGSTKIGSKCMVGGQVGIVGHIEIGDNVMLGAQSGISKSIPKPGLYFGYPAKEFKTAMKLEAHIRNLPNYAEKIKQLETEIKNLKEQINRKEIS